MRTGFRPRRISQIFAPVPAARSRCLSAFVAIARQSLPIPLRYEPSHLLAICGLGLIFVGFFAGSLTRYGGTMVSVGWGSLGLALLALLGQDRLSYGRSRSKLIRQLDEARRSVGLDSVILPESLEFLESTAQQWERIEHALQANAWQGLEGLRFRIDLAAHQAMESILILECGSIDEAGLTDMQADQALTETATNLALLADRVDATSAALGPDPRVIYQSNGISTDGVLPELESLEEVLSKLVLDKQS